MRKPKAPPRAMLTLVFAIVVFCILAITMVIVGTVIYLLVRAGILGELSSPDMIIPIIAFSLISVVTGTIIATVMSSIPLKPINKLIGGLNRLVAGEYEARLDFGNHPLGQDLSESFNLLASELENTEMFRSDFVNNFSHEFKTPIVSVRGFAKVLQKSDLSEEQREYVDIIVEEASRLADMATNTLNLTKVENQTILTDVTRFNLSEQLRDCILLLEGKWDDKNLNIIAEFDEVEISANEELLKQIWVNLIDNSVKFSPEGGDITVSLTEAADTITVLIKNNGPEISADEAAHIFNKYWQGDTSRATEGTGIGLSIAKRIAELHDGIISVASTPQETTFCVKLPKE